MMDTPVLFRSNTVGDIVALGLPEDVYLRDYAENFCEWINGTVIQMSPVHLKHNRIRHYLLMLFKFYFHQQ